MPCPYGNTNVSSLKSCHIKYKRLGNQGISCGRSKAEGLPISERPNGKLPITVIHNHVMRQFREIIFTVGKNDQLKSCQSVYKIPLLSK